MPKGGLMQQHLIFCQHNAMIIMIGDVHNIFINSHPGDQELFAENI